MTKDDNKIDFKNYTNKELIEALNRINKDLHFENYNLCLSEINFRNENQIWDEDHQISNSNSVENLPMPKTKFLMKRLISNLIDQCFLLSITLIPILIFHSNEYIMLVLQLCTYLYFLISYINSQSLGMKITKLKIVSTNMTNMSLLKGIVYTFLNHIFLTLNFSVSKDFDKYFSLLFAFIYVLNFILILFQKQNRSLFQIITNTIILPVNHMN